MYQQYYGDRQFVVPFLVGALAGGAAVGISRPRPIVATNYPVSPYNYGPYNYYPYYRY